MHCYDVSVTGTVWEVVSCADTTAGEAEEQFQAADIPAIAPGGWHQSSQSDSDRDLFCSFGAFFFCADLSAMQNQLTSPREKINLGFIGLQLGTLQEHPGGAGPNRLHQT